MYIRTYFDKCNTIVKDSYYNHGINPIGELNYGGDVSRFIFHFNTDNIESYICDKTFADTSKLKHTLKMYNCASINNVLIDKKLLTSTFTGLKERASAFDLIFFLIPKEWDGGRGFDYARDLNIVGTNNALTTYGSNWYNSKTGIQWDEEGIYSWKKLSLEYDKFSSTNGNLSNIIIGRQHFEYGNEMIQLDVTDIVNKFINGEIPNYGIGVAFTPLLEIRKEKLSQYVGFFTKYTNSFYEPFIETQYQGYIQDDRYDFYLDKQNKLCFYSFLGGKPTNLDELPVCEVNGAEIASKQITKGVYEVEVELSSDEHSSMEMVYDTWKNLKLNGKALKDVELDFVTKESDEYFHFGTDEDVVEKKYVPSIKGIQYNEKIRRGDIRKVVVQARVPYTTNDMEVIDGMEYRIYVLDGNEDRELDIYGYEPMNKATNQNYFLLDTDCLLPQRYYIDIKMVDNLEVKHFRKVLSFDIVNDVSEVYV